MSYILAKESPFLEPLKRTIYEMMQSGIINEIWEKYQPNLNTECNEPKVIIYQHKNTFAKKIVLYKYIFSLDFAWLSSTNVSNGYSPFWNYAQYNT